MWKKLKEDRIRRDDQEKSAADNVAAYNTVADKAAADRVSTSIAPKKATVDKVTDQKSVSAVEATVAKTEMVIIAECRYRNQRLFSFSLYISLKLLVTSPDNGP